MKIHMTFDYDEYYRRVVNAHFGQTKPASRQEMMTWIEMVLDAEFDVIQFEYDRSDAAAHNDGRDDA